MRPDRPLLSRAPVTVTVAGRHFHLPYRPAAVWLDAAGRLPVLVSRLAEPDDREALVDLVMDHPNGAEDVRLESRRVLALVSGWKWWEAAKLINTSLGSEVLGRLVLAGVDPWQRTLGEWCAATYALCAKGTDAQSRLKLDFSLSVPPPGAEDGWDDGGDDAEATLSAVQAMMGQR